MEASIHLARLQVSVSEMQKYIALGLLDGCLPTTEVQLEHLKDDMEMFFLQIRLAMEEVNEY